MKKTLVIITLALFAYACGGDGGKTESTETPAAAQVDPDVEKGLELVGKSDCKGCHQVLASSVGPAHAEVAKKYENTPANIEMLADKIIKGGTGNWGTVPMAAHSDISKEDAILMAKYVLSLKDAK